MTMEKFKILISTIFSAAILSACGGDTDTSSEASASSTSGSTKGKVVYSVLNKKVATRGNPPRPEQGLGCSIGMKIANKTDREISLVQIMEYTAKTSKGDIFGHGVNFRLQSKKVTDRAALYVKGATCEDIEKITVQRLACDYSGVSVLNSGTDNCLNEVVVNGTKNIPIEVSDTARKPMITVTP